jgi:hypothetical protein
VTQVSVVAGGSVSVDVFADVAGLVDPASVVVTSGPKHGSVAVDPLTGWITYTPDPGFQGQDTFTWAACELGEPDTCATGSVLAIVGLPATSTIDPAEARSDAAGFDLVLSIVALGLAAIGYRCRRTLLQRGD